MFWVICGIIFAVAAAFASRIQLFIASFQRRRQQFGESGDASTPPNGFIVRCVCMVLAAGCFLATSFVSVGENETGHLVRIYAPKSLEPGHIIATGMTAGPQAEVIPPGVHFSFLVNVLNRVEMLPVLEVPDGEYAHLVAKDGLSLSPGQAFANPVSTEELVKMVTDAEYALSHGLQRGPQVTVLPPGKYRINRYVWDAKLGDALNVDKGMVAVIKSNVRGEANFGALSVPNPSDCNPLLTTTSDDERALSVPVVPVGCQGIWNIALVPGRYYINMGGGAYTAKIVNTRLHQWEYKGGYKKRVVHLTVAENGKLDQVEDPTVDVTIPADAADSAIFAKVEGWDVPIELRVLVQVSPEDAPYTVAAVGGLEEVEDRVITPSIRAITRDVVGGMIRTDQPVMDQSGNVVVENGQPKTTTVFRQARVLDLINNRPALEETILRHIRPEGSKARVAIKEVRFGESVIPPEVLIPQQRQQLAAQLAKAYAEEKSAQDQRVQTEQARATADQQSKLVEAQIDRERSVMLAQAKENEGKGEKARLTAIAEGQRIQATALGEGRVMELRKYELAVDRVFNLLDAHPDIITAALSNAQKFVPERIFTIGADGGNSTVGAFGVLGELLNSANASANRKEQKN